MKEKLEVLITSGGTISKIDDVRHVGNFSSGTTGMYIAEAFLKAGENVHFVYSKNSKRPLRERLNVNPTKPFDEEVNRLATEYSNYHKYKDSLQEYKIETFDEYYQTLENILKNKKIDVVVLAAAVSDYSAVRQEGKISSDLDEMSIKMKRNPKVISLIKEWAPDVFQVGFKLLSNVSKEKLLETGYEHLLKNKSDLVVANSLKGGFGARDIYLITPDKKAVEVNERQLADKLVEEVENRVRGGS
jgi:phosphopantothenate-cysteine ligase